MIVRSTNSFQSDQAICPFKRKKEVVGKRCSTYKKFGSTGRKERAHLYTFLLIIIPLVILQVCNLCLLLQLRNDLLFEKLGLACNLTFPIRGRSFDFSRLLRMCDTAPQHFNVFATSSSLSIYSSSVRGKDLWINDKEKKINSLLHALIMALAKKKKNT